MKVIGLASLLTLGLIACEEKPPEPESRSGEAADKSKAALSNGYGSLGKREGRTQGTTQQASSKPAPTAQPRPAKPVASVPVSPDDPVKGQFTLKEATAGLPGKGALVAEIDTDQGKLSCELFEDKAPISVANFVGLARGKRPFKNPEGKWEKKAAYDGTTFHRVVPGFMIQGGDPKGNGSGEPGYVIPDEIWENAAHDRAGLLCMANRGPNTNGMQFFITDGAAPHLDSGYTIFGECEPLDVVKKIASVPARGDRAVDPVKIKSVKVKRDASKAKTAETKAAPPNNKAAPDAKKPAPKAPASP